MHDPISHPRRDELELAAVLHALREAGVIRQRTEGTTRVNTLREDDLEARFPGVLRAILAAGDQRSIVTSSRGFAQHSSA